MKPAIAYSLLAVPVILVCMLIFNSYIARIRTQDLERNKQEKKILQSQIDSIKQLFPAYDSALVQSQRRDSLLALSVVQKRKEQSKLKPEYEKATAVRNLHGDSLHREVTDFQPEPLE